MSNDMAGFKSLALTPPLYDYMLRKSGREPEVEKRLRAETAERPMALMQVPPEEALFLGVLARAIGARRCLEVGVFTGLSALAVARALPPDGVLVACDVDADAAAVGQRYWTEAGVADRIDLRIGDARETLDALIAAGEAGRFDMAFIDADKEGYAAYWERALTLLRPHGLIVVDNVLWNGAVIDPAKTGPMVDAVRAFNDMAADDHRVDLCMLPVGDGMTLAVKRP